MSIFNSHLSKTYEKKAHGLDGPDHIYPYEYNIRIIGLHRIYAYDAKQIESIWICFIQLPCIIAGNMHM